MKIEKGDVDLEAGYQPKSDRELRQLALDLRTGQAFGSWQVHESDLSLLPNIFMPILFMSDITRKVLKRDKVVHYYGHMSNASSRAINGYPIFDVISFLNAEDCKRLNAHLKALAEFMGDGEGA